MQIPCARHPSSRQIQVLLRSRAYVRLIVSNPALRWERLLRTPAIRRRLFNIPQDLNLLTADTTGTRIITVVHGAPVD